MAESTKKIEHEYSYPLDLEGVRTFVIGGGTSLVGFDFSHIEYEFKIGANLAAIRAHCNVLVSIDRNFIANYREEITTFGRNGLPILGYPPDVDLDRVPHIPGAVHCTRLRNSSLSLREYELNGTNSGWAAFQQAVQANAPEIHLLGLDFRPGRHGRHFFGRYRHSSGDPSAMRNWWRSFHDCADDVKERGIKVINWVGTPESTIECFEKMDLRDLPAWLSQ
jgi:hypothetical protein